MNKKIILIISVTLLAFSFLVYQYAKEFQSDFASATGTKPANGHLWSEMECDSSGLCIDSMGGRVGIGTATPSTELEVNGNIKVDGDICNGVGKCLGSNITPATFYYGANATCPSGMELLMKAGSDYVWYTADKVLSAWDKIMCGTKTQVNSDYLLYNGEHTNSQCLALPSAVIFGTTVAPTTYTSSEGIKMCKVPISTTSSRHGCPVGWKSLENWSETTATHACTIPAATCGSRTCPAESFDWNWTAHSFSNTNTTTSPLFAYNFAMPFHFIDYDSGDINPPNCMVGASLGRGQTDCSGSSIDIPGPCLGASASCDSGYRVTYRGCY